MSKKIDFLHAVCEKYENMKRLGTHFETKKLEVKETK